MSGRQDSQLSEDLPEPPKPQGRDWAAIFGAIIAGVIVVGIVGAVLAIRPVRRIAAAILVASFGWTGCEIVVGSYTERHCDAFEEAWDAQDPSLGDEVVALATPPEGETVDPDVQDAALSVVTITLLDGPEDQEAELVEALLAACAGDLASSNGDGTTGGDSQTSALTLWTDSLGSFNQAMDDYLDYFETDYNVAFDLSDLDQTISDLTEVQVELLSKLAIVVELHEALGPALEDAIAEDAIPLDDVSDLREYVDLLGQWLAIQQEVAEASLDCLQLPRDRLVACELELDEANRERSDRLVDQIGEVEQRLFGSS